MLINNLVPLYVTVFYTVDWIWCTSTTFLSELLFLLNSVRHIAFKIKRNSHSGSWPIPVLRWMAQALYKQLFSVTAPLVQLLLSHRPSV